MKLNPDWGAVAHGFVPSPDTGDLLLYCYFACLLGAAMTPYEVYFYSSSPVEEGWTRATSSGSSTTRSSTWRVGAAGRSTISKSPASGTDGPSWRSSSSAAAGGSIPWDCVAKVDSAVHLKLRAEELRLGRGDDRVRPWMARLPLS